MNIKIECACGTKYAFDIEPENGRMPVEVACPNCGVDGTAAANDCIKAHSASTGPVRVQPKPVTGAVRVALAPSSAPPPAPAPAPSAAPVAETPVAAAPAPVAHCTMCQKPIDVNTLQKFGYFCSVYCQNQAQQRGVSAPQYDGMHSTQRAKQARKEMNFIYVAAMIAILLAAAWAYYVFYASQPRVILTVDLGQGETPALTRLLSPSEALVLKGATLTLHNIDKGNEVWAATLPGVRAAAKESEASRDSSDRRLIIIGSDIWAILPSKAFQVDRKTGKVRKDVALPESMLGVSITDQAILTLSENSFGQPVLTRLLLADGSLQSETLSNTAPGRLYMSRAATRAKGDDDLHLHANDNKMSGPPATCRTDLLPLGSEALEVDVQLLEAKYGAFQAIKVAKSGSVLDKPNLSAAGGMGMAESFLNEMRNDQGGGRDFEDQSRYRITTRRRFAGSDSQVLAEVEGPTALFPLDSVDALISGRMLRVFDKQGKKLWESPLAYPAADYSIIGRINRQGPDQPMLRSGRMMNYVVAPDRMQLVSMDLADWLVEDRYVESQINAVGRPAHAQAVMQSGNTLYCFDKGVLVAFDTLSGNVKWRMTVVGVNKITRDRGGKLYVCGTTSSPDAIQYTKQVKITAKDQPQLMKVNAATGQVLWQASYMGEDCLVTGKFLYSTRAQVDSMELLQVRSRDASQPINFHLFRVNPSNGNILWEVHRSDMPLNVEAQQNRILLQFRNKLEIIHFTSL